MRFFWTFLISAFLSVAIATGKEMPFSESAKGLLDIQNLTSLDVERLDAFVSRMDDKSTSFKKSKNFIAYLNEQAHKEILLGYQQLSSLEELVSQGKYNCLTGSTFFALLLERYKISYKVIETNYHMFILIEDDDREYLLDVTDVVDGFVTDAISVKKRLAKYKAKNEELNQNKVAFQFKLFNEVTISELEGLLSYNRSVEAFNNQNFLAAVDHLYHASLFYTSPRISEMAGLIESHLQTATPTLYLKKIARMKQHNTMLLAQN